MPTDWDLEIRKRYNQSLSHETLEFPDAASIQHRMLPICYEEALPNGPADQCAEFVATATEMYIKDVVSQILSLVRSNNLPHHHASRNLVNGARKNVLGSVGGRPLSLADMRVALGISSCNMGHMPDIIEDVMSSWPEGVLEGWDTYDQEIDFDVRPHTTYTSTPHLNVNAVPSTQDMLANGKMSMVNGVGVGPPAHLRGAVGGSAGLNGHASARERGDVEAMAGRRRGVFLTNGEMANGFKGFEEAASDGWPGSSTMDRQRLFSVLDECLTSGQ